MVNRGGIRHSELSCIVLIFDEEGEGEGEECARPMASEGASRELAYAKEASEASGRLDLRTLGEGGVGE
ncbi:hypothetical protein GUJ93_ZPchr0006g40802 [Zizania palustris]|uniref:Uncharacterized protein n=1 Tax=Zizania palustris TaxID=103762 RepID=A0A8J5VM78_ZIZPA|nr:hypothetical protein GUJ93_ZPchr0006g40802 [Zizania palustris]